MLKLSRAILLFIFLLAFSGCVRREMVITSEPSEVDVWVNEEWQGKTPYTLPFKHYGVFSVRLEKRGFYPMYIKEPLKAPFYQRIGPDLIAEAVVPVTITDQRELHYVMQPVKSADEVTEVMERCEQMVANTEPMLERRLAYDEQRSETNLPLLPEKNASRRQSPTAKRATLSSTTPRTAPDLEQLPPLEPLK